jgi:hypothetical protein
MPGGLAKWDGGFGEKRQYDVRPGGAIPCWRAALAGLTVPTTTTWLPSSGALAAQEARLAPASHVTPKLD